MRFFREHETARAREWFETGFSERGKLILAVAIGKHREREEVEPVVAWLIERFENARLVGIAAAAFEQRVGFVAAVAAEVAVQQINHGPQMATFFDVHLKQIAQVVKRRTRLAELSLLFNWRGFGVALRDDDASQRVAKLAGHFLVRGAAVVVAKTDDGVGFSWFEKDAPAIVRHLHVIEMSPAFGA